MLKDRLKEGMPRCHPTDPHTRERTRIQVFEVSAMCLIRLGGLGDDTPNPNPNFVDE